MLEPVLVLDYTQAWAHQWRRWPHPLLFYASRVMLGLLARTYLENSYYEKLKWLKVNDRVKQIKLFCAYNCEWWGLKLFYGIIFTRLGIYINIPLEGALLTLYQLGVSLVWVERHSCSLLLSFGTVWDLRAIGNLKRFKTCLKKWWRS